MAGGESPPVIELDVSPLTHATHRNDERVVAKVQYDSAEKVRQGHGEVKDETKEAVEIVLDDVYRHREGISREEEVSPSLSSSPVSDIEEGFAEKPLVQEPMPSVESLQLTTTTPVSKVGTEGQKATDSAASLSTQRVPRSSAIGEVRFMTEPLAREIIVWRQERGSFKFLRDLKRIVSTYSYYRNMYCRIVLHILHYLLIYTLLHRYIAGTALIGCEGSVPIAAQ